MGGDCRPLLLHIAMVRIRTLVPDALENHWITLIRFGTPRRTPSRYDLACFCGSATTRYPRAEPASPEAAAILKGDSLDEPAIQLGAPMEDDEPIPSRLFQPASDAGPARRGRESDDTVKTQTRQP